ncbi:MAG: thiamine pyrophosphate-binding protein [Desulfatiglandales bacterium]
MTVMTGRKAIMEIFQTEGVRHIFGNPGTTELGFIDMLQDYPKIRYILALHEGVALGIAHMYANASGKTGVVNLHVAPGLGNAIGALYNAYVGKMPLVVTVGQQDTRMIVREACLSHDLVAMAKPLTKWAVQLQHAEEIPVILPRAFKVSQDPPRGPVLVSLPGNVIEEETDFDLPNTSDPFRRTRPDPKGISAAADLLIKADHPAIICGDGVASSQAQEELVKMAELVGAQVWSTMFTGSLNFPATHPQYRGDLPPEHRAIRLMLGESDLILAVGANLFDEVFYNSDSPLPEGCELIHLDNSLWEIGKNLPTKIGLLADPKLALQELLTVVESKMEQTIKERVEERRALMASQKKEELERQKKRAQEKWDSSPISTARLMAELNEYLPDDVVIYSESITATADLMRTLQPDKPGSLFGNHGGGIGQGLPGALGVKLANPDRPVIAIIGDGSAMYSVQSFWTAAHHNIAVVYIIISNQSYRILKYNMNRYRRTQKIAPRGQPYPFMDLTDPPLDFVEIAHGMGIDGKLITKPDDIKEALREALSIDRPYILEVRTEGGVPKQ